MDESKSLLADLVCLVTKSREFRSAEDTGLWVYVGIAQAGARQDFIATIIVLSASNYFIYIISMENKARFVRH